MATIESGVLPSASEANTFRNKWHIESLGRIGLVVAFGGAVLFGVDKSAFDFMPDAVAVSELTFTVGAGGGTAMGSFIAKCLT